MKKFSEFRINNMIRNACEGSIYFNKNMMMGYNKIANYFDIYFASGIRQELDKYIFNRGDVKVYNELFSELIMRKISAMGEMVYDENNNGFNSNNNYGKVDHDENRKMIKYFITCNLIMVYYSNLVKCCSIVEAERRVERLMYEAAIYWKVDGVLDYVVTRGEVITNNEVKENDNNGKNKAPLTYNNNMEREILYNDDYDYGESKEKSLFKTILSRNITYCHNMNIKRNILDTFRNFNDMYERERAVRCNANFEVLNIIKESMLQIGMMKMDLGVKDKVLKSLQKIKDDAIFNEEKTYLDMKDVLEYEENNRPNHKCEKIIEAFKDDYQFTGKVYHGFTDRWHSGNSAENVLKGYVEGFISCSKDIRIARNFATMKSYDDISKGDISYGAVLEINITEEHVAVDIEEILKEQYAKNSNMYGRLYDSYIREKEVLVKLPVVTYNVLHKDEVERIIKDLEENENEQKR